MSFFVVRDLFGRLYGGSPGDAQSDTDANGEPIVGWLTARAAGEPLKAFFGARHIKAPAELVPNKYLWVPLKASRAEWEPGPTAQGHRTFWGRRQHWQVRCYGENHAVASAMLENVAAALYGVADGSTSLGMVGEAWADAVEGEESPQDGELLIGEFTWLEAFAKRYVHIGRRVMNTPQVPVVEDAPTVQPTSIELSFYTSPDGSTDGELLGVDVIPVP